MTARALESRKFPDLALGLSVIQSGKLGLLAVGTERRSPALPEAPTSKQLGVTACEAFAFQGIGGPAGIADPVVARLNPTLADPAVVTRFIDVGLETLPGTPARSFEATRAESWR